jgi:ATP-binding cassette subfamily F protein 3
LFRTIPGRIPHRAAEARKWQAKHAELLDGLDRAEALWLAAQERLEAAGR